MLETTEQSGISWLPRFEYSDSTTADAEAIGRATILIDEAKLAAPQLWHGGERSLDRALQLLGEIGASHGEIVSDRELEHAESVFRRAHAIAAGDEAVEPFDYAFVVPTRTSSGGYSAPTGATAAEIGASVLASPGMEYIAEVEHVLPFVDRLDPLTRTQLWSAMPTSIVERYHPSPSGRRGAVVYAPLTIDAVFTADSRRALRDLAVATIGEGLDFARRVGGATFAGLGAFYPSLTRYGQLVAREGMGLTTGHAGTIAVMAKTLDRILGAPGYEHCSTIGIVGAGAIGTSTVDHLCATTDHDFVVFDTSRAASVGLAARIGERHGLGRVEVVSGMQRVCDRTRIVMAATTTPVPFDTIDEPASLEGLVIVDDSEPGAFNDPRFREAGARPVGVVAEVPLDLGRRANGYNYGRELAIAHHVYGCEAELKALDELGLRDQGITRRAEPADVAFVQGCFDRLGIVASPLQYRGELELLA